MPIPRPDLTQVDPSVRAYIESLEAELRRQQEVESAPDLEILSEPPEPGEPPTTINVITLTAGGIGKRTPRHLYTRQRRGGMGVFDLETNQGDPPAILVTADESQSLLLFTNQGRVFRLPVHSLPAMPVHARGQLITGRLHLETGERLVAALPDLAKGSVALVSPRGYVRCLRHHVFGEYMKPGTMVFDVHHLGLLAHACWTPGDGDLFIATRLGKAIRFSEKLVPPQGGPGIRCEGDDQVVTVAAVYPESHLFLACADGKGTIRQMTSGGSTGGFMPNKSTGGGGKIAMHTSALVSVFAVHENADIFMISRLSKIIRFRAAEVPPKEGVVQGVVCMSLRADEVTTACIST